VRVPSRRSVRGWDFFALVPAKERAPSSMALFV